MLHLKFRSKLLTTDMERTKKEAEVIQALLQDSLGIVINISLVPRADRLSREDTGDYEMVISGILPDYPDPISFLESWETTSPYNHTNYSNPEYDALLEKAYADGNATTRFDTLFEAEKLSMEDGGLVPAVPQKCKVGKYGSNRSYKLFLRLQYQFCSCG